jgi:pimeloyl-ACP methyl ester carboxylesterase
MAATISMSSTICDSRRRIWFAPNSAISRNEDELPDEDGVKPPAAVKRLAQRIAGAKTVILGGTGHWTPIERPSAVNEALLKFYFG